MNNKYDYFKSTQHYPLRIYNCAVFACNIYEDMGSEPFQQYISGFTQKERVDMYYMIKAVREHGVKQIQKMVTNGVVFSDEEWRDVASE